MSFVNRQICKCDLCQHEWISSSGIPTHCSRCKSRQWNTPSLNAAYRLSIQGFRETFTLQVIGKLGEACGVYAIVRGDDLMYIGRSIRVMDRCRGHKCNQESFKPTDIVWWLPTIAEELNSKEIEMIALLDPRLNKQAGGKASKLRPGHRYAS